MNSGLSSFSYKVLSGLSPSIRDWNDHLVEAHRISPAMTPAAFAGYTTINGQNSYEVLVESLSSFQDRRLRLLDLACGDGHLASYCAQKIDSTGTYLGIDMVDTEIAIAKSRFKDPRISFQCARAESLPVSNNSIDGVLCHLALMLMLPIEPVISEISRILTKGGKFAGVIGGGRPTGPIAGDAIQTIGKYVKEKYPAFIGAKFGDERTQTLEGLKLLFNESLGFSKHIEIQDFNIVIKNDSDEDTWNFFKDMYLVGLLPIEERLGLKRQLLDLFRSHRVQNSEFQFAFPLRKIEVVKSHDALPPINASKMFS